MRSMEQLLPIIKLSKIEYQDSCGFVLYAQDAQELYEGISDKIQTAHPEEHKAISSSMSELAKACPSLIPSTALVKTPKGVAKTVNSIKQNAQSVIENLTAKHK